MQGSEKESFSFFLVALASKSFNFDANWIK